MKPISRERWPGCGPFLRELKMARGQSPLFLVVLMAAAVCVHALEPRNVQLNSSTLLELSRTGVAVVDHALGPSYASAVFDEANDLLLRRRFIAVNTSTPGDDAGSNQQHGEILTSMHSEWVRAATPALRRFLGVSDKLREQLSGRYIEGATSLLPRLGKSTEPLLSLYSNGSLYRPHYDVHPDDNSSPLTYALLYYPNLGWAGKVDGGMLKVQQQMQEVARPGALGRDDDHPWREIAPLPDRMVLIHARRVKHQVTKVTLPPNSEKRGRFALMAWWLSLEGGDGGEGAGGSSSAATALDRHVRRIARACCAWGGRSLKMCRRRLSLLSGDEGTGMGRREDGRESDRRQASQLTAIEMHQVNVEMVPTAATTTTKTAAAPHFAVAIDAVAAGAAPAAVAVSSKFWCASGRPRAELSACLRHAAERRERDDSDSGAHGAVDADAALVSALIELTTT